MYGIETNQNVANRCIHVRLVFNAPPFAMCRAHAPNFAFADALAKIFLVDTPELTHFISPIVVCQSNC